MVGQFQESNAGTITLNSIPCNGNLTTGVPYMPMPVGLVDSTRYLIDISDMEDGPVPGANFTEGFHTYNGRTMKEQGVAGNLTAWLAYGSASRLNSGTPQRCPSRSSDYTKGRLIFSSAAQVNVRMAWSNQPGDGTFVSPPCRYNVMTASATASETTPTRAGNATNNAISDIPTSSPPTSTSSPPTSPPTATPSTASTITDYKVKISLLLATTMAQFNETVRKSLRGQLAVAAALKEEDFEKVNLEVAATSRRLLASGVAVNATISVADKAAADKAVAGLTKTNIDALLAAANLPTATITIPASVMTTVITGGPVPTPKPSAAPGRAPGTALALLAVALAAAVRT